MTTASQNNSPRKMNENYFVGIDVAKQELVVHVLPSNQQLVVQHSIQGIKEIIKCFKKGRPRQIVLEATGGLERKLLVLLVTAGFEVVCLNPRQARDLAKGLGQLAKTDAVDARMLATFASLQCLKARPIPSPEIQETNDLVARKQQLVEMKTMELNRRHATTQKPIQKSIEKVVDALNKQIVDIDSRVEKNDFGQPGLERKGQNFAIGSRRGTEDKPGADLGVTGIGHAQSSTNCGPCGIGPDE